MWSRECLGSEGGSARRELDEFDEDTVRISRKDCTASLVWPPGNVNHFRRLKSNPCSAKTLEFILKVAANQSEVRAASLVDLHLDRLGTGRLELQQLEDRSLWQLPESAFEYDILVAAKSGAVLLSPRLA
jgi:hypothetical protein